MRKLDLPSFIEIERSVKIHKSTTYSSQCKTKEGLFGKTYFLHECKDEYTRDLSLVFLHHAGKIDCHVMIFKYVLPLTFFNKRISREIESATHKSTTTPYCTLSCDLFVHLIGCVSSPNPPHKTKIKF